MSEKKTPPRYYGHPRQSTANDKATLVVGMGIAGIKTALEVADSGQRVILVTCKPRISFDQSLPLLDSTDRISTPRMFDVGMHKNIQVLTCSEIEKVEGYIGDFTVYIWKKAQMPDTERCVDRAYDTGSHYLRAVYQVSPFEEAKIIAKVDNIVLTAGYEIFKLLESGDLTQHGRIPVSATV